MKPKKKEFLVALHVLNLPQALEQAKRILTPNGAHGVILVNNRSKVLSDSSEYPNLFDIALRVKSYSPDYLVGVNPLDLDTGEAVDRTPAELDILWTDKGGIYEAGDKAVIDKQFAAILKNSFKPKYYGSELFKYRPVPKNPEAVAKCASENFTALITSGDATGSQPDIEKIRKIREWIGPNAKLGIASGMSVENIDDYLPYADIFIVATSLCENLGNGDDFYKYDKEKVQAFRAKIDGWRNP